MAMENETARQRKAEYMREYGKRRIRSKEARHAEYQRRKERGSLDAAYAAFLNSTKYAAKLVASDLGVRPSDVPQELVEAKSIHLNLLRAVKAVQEEKLPQVASEMYLSRGINHRELAKEIGVDVARLKRMLVESGAFPRPSSLSCANGHLWSEANNLAFTKDGYRLCRRCSADKSARYYLRRKQQSQERKP